MKKPILTICVMIFTIIVISNNAWGENVFYDNIENNFTEQPTINVQPSDTLTVTIGTDDTYDWNFPYFYWWRNGLSEIIYMSEEIIEQGVSTGLLTELILYYDNNCALPEQNIAIWVGETAFSSPPEEWISAEELTLVYEGIINIPLWEGELHLPFNESYSYNGGNLVIMIHRPWHYTYGGNLCFYYTNTPDYPNRAIYNYSDIIEFDPFDPPLGSYYLSWVPNTTLIFTTENNGSKDYTVGNPNSEIAHLSNNYPNPFNPITQIKLSVYYDSHIKIDIYNIRGQLVKNLIDEQISTGVHNINWDSTNNKNDKVSSGIYFYNLKIEGKNSITKKMVLVE